MSTKSESGNIINKVGAVSSALGALSSAGGKVAGATKGAANKALGLGTAGVLINEATDGDVADGVERFTKWGTELVNTSVTDPVIRHAIEEQKVIYDSTISTMQANGRGIAAWFGGLIGRGEGAGFAMIGQILQSVFKALGFEDINIMGLVNRGEFKEVHTPGKTFGSGNTDARRFTTQGNGEMATNLQKQILGENSSNSPTSPSPQAPANNKTSPWNSLQINLATPS